MPRRIWHGFLALAVAIGLSGCGGAGDLAAPAPGGAPASSATKGVVLVGFDASEPLVDAMRQGKIQGLVVQNPVRMGATGVKTLIDHLEKRPVEVRVSTGEVMVTLPTT